MVRYPKHGSGPGRRGEEPRSRGEIINGLILIGEVHGPEEAEGLIAHRKMQLKVSLPASIVRFGKCHDNVGQTC
jgi:hypothetical protein